MKPKRGHSPPKQKATSGMRLAFLKQTVESDHPLADPKAARAALEALPQRNPVAAIETLTDYLDSVREAEGLSATRVHDIIESVDQAAKAIVRRLTVEYLEADGEQRAHATRIAHVVADFWNHLARGYRMLLEMHDTGDPSARDLQPKLGVIAARGVRAFTLHLKWRLFRYSPVDPALWGCLARVFAIADQNGIADTPVVVYPGAWGESTVRREMLKSMMLAISATDTLPKMQIEIVERLCAQYSEFFTLQEHVAPGVHFQFDTHDDLAPARATGESRSKGLRFFGPGGAAPHLKKLAQDIRTSGAIPSTVNLGGAYPVPEVIEVLEHLARYWAPTPPSRKERRRASEEVVEVVHGFKDILGAVDADEFGWDFDVTKFEDWTLSNESAVGFGATVPVGRSEWVTLGELVGLKYVDEGAAWSVGVVRRISQTAGDLRSIGIELYSRGVIRVLMYALMSDGTHHPDPERSVDALLLPSSADNSLGKLTVRVAVRHGSYDPRASYGLMLYGMDYLLVPKSVVDATQDYVVVEYKLLQRSHDDEDF